MCREMRQRWPRDHIGKTLGSRGEKDIDSGVERNGHEASLLSRPIVRDKSLARFTLGTGDLAGFPRDSRDSCAATIPRTLLYQSSIDPRQRDRECVCVCVCVCVHWESLRLRKNCRSETLDQLRTVEAICCPLCLRMFTFAKRRAKVAFPLGNWIRLVTRRLVEFIAWNLNTMYFDVAKFFWALRSFLLQQPSWKVIFDLWDTWFYVLS